MFSLYYSVCDWRRYRNLLHSKSGVLCERQGFVRSRRIRSATSATVTKYSSFVFSVE